VDQMEGDVTVSDVACGSVLVTIEADDLTDVETVEEIIVNEGVDLPNYGRVGGPTKGTAEEGVDDWIIAVIAVAVVILVFAACCFICKIMEKETQTKRSELRKHIQNNPSVDLELAKSATPEQTNYSGTQI